VRKLDMSIDNAVKLVITFGVLSVDQAPSDTKVLGK
jgi:uncharacterized membrane protein